MELSCNTGSRDRIKGICYVFILTMESISTQEKHCQKYSYGFSRAEVLLCRNEDEMCFVESVTVNADTGKKRNCSFWLHYPLWHVRKFTLQGVTMDELTRAAIWYAEDGEITDSTLGGIKAVRECKNISLKRCKADSPEFGWKSQGIHLEDTEITSEYLLFDSRDVSLKNVKMKGKYSFQYIENLTIENCELVFGRADIN